MLVDSVHAYDDAGDGRRAKARVGIWSRSHTRRYSVLEPWAETLLQSLCRSSFFVSPLLGHRFFESPRRRVVVGGERSGNRTGAGRVGGAMFAKSATTW